MNQNIPYILKISSRAKYLRLTIKPDGQVTITKPRWLSQRQVDRFWRAKQAWVRSRLSKIKSRPQGLLSKYNRSHYLKNKDTAKQFIIERLSYFNEFYNFEFGRISIRNQKTRWGSCSKDKNLNFSYKLLFLPRKLADYIVVHELCHLKELNHSKNFWQLVERTIPDYNQTRKKLRQY